MCTKVKVQQWVYKSGQAVRALAGRQSVHEGGKVVSPTHRPPLLTDLYVFCGHHHGPSAVFPEKSTHSTKWMKLK
jgi:hypothetical protein